MIRGDRRFPKITRTGAVGLTVAGGLLLGIWIYRPLGVDVTLHRWLRQPISLQRLQAHRGRSLAGVVIEVRGRVGDRAPLVEAQMYELIQGDTRLLVVTPRLDLQTGDRVQVRGRLQQAEIEQEGAIAHREYYLVEEEI